MHRNYDQAGLDAQYNLRERFPHFQEYFDRWERESRRVRETLPCELDIAYGEAPGQTLDMFPAATPGAPLHVFIHGGYWRSLDKQDFSFLAEPLVAAGSSVAVINYALAPSVGMDEIVRQVLEAIAWSRRNAGAYNGDGERLFVSGHSAGGHLTAMALNTDWQAFAGLPADTVKGGCAISGLFDLEPVRLCYLNEEVRLDAEAAHRNSPIHDVRPERAPLIVAVGGSETDEFLHHFREFAEAWRGAGNPCTTMELDGLTHFSVLDELSGPGGVITKAILQQMGLRAGAA